ncbi:MAG: hypothetical protein HZB31_08310 [Nitrospirae bacterium]|nr:hypothetical protein [Nitrospirota bacterium]
MLYELHLPDSARYLDWVVALQHCLLEGLCQHATQPAHVDEAWVEQCTRALNPDPDWLRRFCGWSRESKSLLELMRRIAGFPPAAKDAVIVALDNDLKVHQAFNAPIHNLIGVTNLDHAHAETIKEFCERFYDPGFDRGYQVPDGNQYIELRRTKYVDEFKNKNEHVQVCPFCDGYPTGIELDHFYPKRQYPYLSCHQLNLVPICHDCNKPGAKHQTPPLTTLTLDQTQDWFLAT